MSDIKIIALGGVRENAKNLYIVEINDSIFILDAGLKYPENEQLGVDFVIPNLDYLIENRDRIQGIFLTHGHADAIGALFFLSHGTRGLFPLIIDWNFHFYSFFGIIRISCSFFYIYIRFYRS